MRPVRSTNPRQNIEHAGGIAASGWRFAGGQSEFSLGHRKSGNRVEQQQHVLAAITKCFGYGGCSPSCRDSLRRRSIAGRHDHDAARQPRRPEAARDEFLNFAASFANQSDHNSVGIGSTSQHSQQGTLANAGPGKDPKPLAVAAREQRIDRTNPGAQR